MLRLRRRAVMVHRLNQPRHPRHRVGLLLLAPLVLTWILGGVAVAEVFPVIDAVAGALPPPVALPADTLVYDRSGGLIAELHAPGVSRLPVPLSAIATPMQKATVAIEDRNFWTEGATDNSRLAAAAWNALRNGSPQGGSTIPMQLAKLLYLNDDRSLVYKIRQIGYADKLVSVSTKDDILDQYLNDVPFSESAVGVEAAAHVYFGIPAASLDLAQSALLAGLPNAPGADDPFVYPDRARARQLAVLQAMASDGYITDQQAVQAASEQLHFANGSADNVNLFPAFVSRVSAELGSSLHVNPLTAGLRVVTTLDTNLQLTAEQVVAQQVSRVRGLNVTDGALVSMDPQSGDVVAYVGSAGPSSPGHDIDMAAHPRQMGSSFKLFTYPTAIGAGKISMLSPVLDAPIAVRAGTSVWRPNDYDRRWHGTVPIALALGNSLNIPAVRVELAAGTANVVRTARSMGVTTLGDDPASYGPSLTLGTYPVPLWEMAQAATVYADQGRLHPAEFVVEASDGSGHVLYRPGQSSTQVLDPGVAYIMNAILSTDSNRWMEFGRGSALTLADHVVSAKTGTTDEFKDNVTVGWTPHLVTATWVGNADDEAMHGTTGITGAAPIWHDFMNLALRGQSDDWTGPPADVHQMSEVGRIGWFLPGTDPGTGAAELSGRGISAGVGTTDVTRSGGCRYWTYNGVSYWSCGGADSGLPGDPGA